MMRAVLFLAAVLAFVAVGVVSGQEDGEGGVKNGKCQTSWTPPPLYHNLISSFRAYPKDLAELQAFHAAKRGLAGPNIEFDPLNYNDRMTMNKLMISYSSKNVAWVTNQRCDLWEGNLLWGLTIQLEWQKRSQRLNGFQSDVMDFAVSLKHGMPWTGVAFMRLKIVVDGHTYLSEVVRKPSVSKVISIPAPVAIKAGAAGKTARVTLQTVSNYDWATSFFPLATQWDDRGEATFTYPSSARRSTRKSLNFVDAGYVYSTNTAAARVNFEQIRVAPSATDISSLSWWGSMNWILVGPPFFAAQKEGIVPASILVRKPTGSAATKKRFCTSYNECARGTKHKHMKAWTDYWKLYKRLMAKQVPTYSELDSLKRLLWVAHELGLEEAGPKHDRLRHLYGSLEARVDQGWVGSVHLFGATHLSTKMDDILVQQVNLPQVVVKPDWGVVDLVTAGGFNPTQVAVSSTFVAFYEAQQCPPCWSRFMAAWKTAMAASDTNRRNARAAIAQSFTQPSTLPQHIVNILAAHMSSVNKASLVALVGHCGICGGTIASMLTRSI